MIKNYIKIAFRLLVKNKWISLINISGLTVGISVCFLLFLYADYESSFDEYHMESEQVYRVVQKKEFPDDTYYFNITPFPLGTALTADIPEISQVAQVVGPVSQDVKIERNNTLEVLKIEQLAYVNAAYFEVFNGIKWLTKKTNKSLKPDEIALSKSQADLFFGAIADYNLHINKTVMINDQPFTIAAIFDFPSNSNFRFDAAMSYQHYISINPRYAQNWAMTYISTAFVKVNTLLESNNNELRSLEAKINDWKEQFLPENQRDQIEYKLQPLAEVHNNPLYGSSPSGYVISSKTLWTAKGLGLLILLIAIVNFINLTTAQSLNRGKTVGVLKVLGSGRKRLIYRFCIENGLLIIVALIFALITSYLLIDQINGLPHLNNPLLSINTDALLIFSVVGLFTLTLSISYPAFKLSGANPVESFKSKTAISNGGKNLRSGLVIFQFVVLQLFLIGALIVSMQMDLFQSADIGFNKDAVVIVPLPDQQQSQTFKEILLQNPQVLDVSFGSGPPMGINDLSLGTSFRLPEETQDAGIYSELKVGDKNYVSFYELDVLAGTSFTSTRDIFDRFIVNETLIKNYGWTPDEAVGKEITINEGTGIIQGVVADYHNNALQYELTPSVIANWNSYQMNAFIRLNNHSQQTYLSLEEDWKSIFKESSYSFSYLEEDIEREYRTETLIQKGFQIAAGISVFLAIIGLIGLLSFMIANRSREIAIRKVLGSSVSQILKLLGKEFVIFTTIAFLIAVPVTYYIGKIWLENFVFHIDLNIWIFLLGGSATLTLVLIVCLVQAYQKAVSNPVESLRTE